MYYKPESSMCAMLIECCEELRSKANRKTEQQSVDVLTSLALCDCNLSLSELGEVLVLY